MCDKGFYLVWMDAINGRRWPLCPNGNCLLLGATQKIFQLMWRYQLLLTWRIFGMLRIANVIIGWLSPLNQATYHMHNFGYDKLPRLWQSYCIFIGLSVILYFASIRGAKRYNFSFTGTDG